MRFEQLVLPLNSTLGPCTLWQGAVVDQDEAVRSRRSSIGGSERIGRSYFWAAAMRLSSSWTNWSSPSTGCRLVSNTTVLSVVES
jgi:hypothetical protein